MKVKTLFCVLDSFTPQHFVNVAASCDIKLCSNEDKEIDVISTMIAKERAQAMLAQTRVRKEREPQEEKNKNKLLMVQLERQENVVDDIERGKELELEGDSKMSSWDDSRN
jgi:hypothetical protein